MARVAVVGAGIVGTTTALLAADAGHDVTLVDSRDAVWGGASGANEGKIHLGPIFALGDQRTHEIMLRGATAFAPIMERALGRRIDWDALASRPFRYLVMDGSMATPDELAARYGSINDLAASLGTSQYLGDRLDRVVDTSWVVDEATGLPAFDVAERSVDPLALRVLVEHALADANITQALGCRVEAIEDDEDGAWLATKGGARLGPFDAVVNATWDGQQGLMSPAERAPLNIRVKAALRVAGGSDRALTLVHGPFGDVVGFSDYSYLSWYPVGRLANEEATLPTSATLDALDALADGAGIVDDTLDALRSARVWEGDASLVTVTGGVILGQGSLDIDHADSKLHTRSDFGVTRKGRVVTPRSFKFTTGPLVAEAVVREIGESS